MAWKSSACQLDSNLNSSKSHEKTSKRANEHQDARRKSPVDTTSHTIEPHILQAHCTNAKTLDTPAPKPKPKLQGSTC